MARVRGNRRLICDNRRARYDYELFDTFEAGLILLGPEVKSLRAQNAHLNDAWIGLENHKAVLHRAHIAPYPQAGRENPEPDRDRPMLLHAAELAKITRLLREKGFTLVPTKLYFDGPWVKVEFALARGKKSHDKREAIREREDKREVQRALRR